MKKWTGTIMKIYGPIVVSLVLAALAVSIRKDENLGHVEINPTIFGISIFKYGLPIENLWIARGIILCFSIGILSLPGFIDYSVLFPQHLEIEVFFDQEGIRESMAVFSRQDLERVHVPDNYEEFQSTYFNSAKAEVQKIFGGKKDFSLNAQDVHSQGYTSFVMEKLSGFQNYHIKESHGELVHVIERPNQPLLQFKSFFEKLNTKHDYLKPSVREILLKRNVILQPRFKQIFAENLKANGTSFHHTLVGLTKVTFLPFPKFSNTIYLMKLDRIGLIPIGYAIYRD
jgi:hypothetical protein